MNRFTKVFLLSIVLASLSADVFSYDQAVYIWQRAWDTHVEDAIGAVQENTGNFTVLCGDLNYSGSKPSVSPVYIKWPYFTKAGTGVTIAFRVNVKAGKYLATDAVYPAVDSIKEAVANVITSAPDGFITGVQLDYDCPTSKLKDYSRFVRILRERLQQFKVGSSGLGISITALPTWLESNDFPELIRVTDYYVLQLHSFQLPEDLEQAGKIFPEDKALYYADKASKLGRPYYISLPTYGYEVAFTKENDFIGLRAENTPVTWRKDVRRETVMADPNKILVFINELEKKAPKHLLGFYWFRMPLKTDEFNWDIKTFKRVLKGEKPEIGLKLELLDLKDGLHEVYIVNSGEQNVYSNVSFNVKWPENEQALYDLAGPFTGVEKENGVNIGGPAPYVGQKILVGWFRSFDKTKDLNLTISEVSKDEEI